MYIVRLIGDENIKVDNIMMNEKRFVIMRKGKVIRIVRPQGILQIV